MPADSTVIKKIAEDIEAVTAAEIEEVRQSVVEMLADSHNFFRQGVEFHGGYFLVAALSAVLADLDQVARSDLRIKVLIQQQVLIHAARLGETIN